MLTHTVHTALNCCAIVLRATIIGVCMAGVVGAMFTYL